MLYTGFLVKSERVTLENVLLMALVHEKCLIRSSLSLTMPCCEELQWIWRLSLTVWDADAHLGSLGDSAGLR